MKEEGTKLEGIEVGNALALRAPGFPTNWIVGETPQIDPTSLRFVKRGPEGSRSRDVSMKVFRHKLDDNPDWGASKPTSEGRTLSMLANDGEFEITFKQGKNEYKVTLTEPNDFAVWGPHLEHSWVPLKESTIVTFRWVPEGPTD